MNNLPNNWQIKSLGEVAEVIRGISFKPNDKLEYNSPNALPCLRTANIQEKVDWDNLIYIPKYLVKDKIKFLKKGDILISTANSKELVGKVALIDELKYESTFGGFISTIRPNEKLLDYNYFFYYLSESSIQEFLRKISRQTTNIANLSIPDLNDIKIPLPPLPIQKQIAEILEKADEAKQKRKEANNLTDEFLQSVFIEMFGEPVKNLKGWEMKKVKELVSIPLQNGAYFTEDKYTVDDSNGIEMVHMSDAFYETVKSGGLKRVIANASEIDKYELQNSDILIARRSLTLEGAAKACLVKVDTTPLIYESSFIRVRVDPKYLLPIYLFYFFSNENARKAYVLKYVTSSTISGINQSNLSEVSVLVPPLSLQQQFAVIVNKTEALKEKQKQSEQELENLFQSLMQKAFKGELVM